MSTSANVTVANSEMELIIFEVDGLTCVSCDITIRMALGRLDGIENARVSLDPPLVLVQYDPDRLTVPELSTVLMEVGYPALVAADQNAAIAHFDVDALHSTGGNAELEPVDVDQLRAAFNEARDEVRILAVVSPTCQVCTQGYEVVRQVFEQYDSDRLRGFIIWLPMLAGDNPAAAKAHGTELGDDRIALQGWDASRSIGNLLAGTLDLKGTAWDVYLIYEAGAVWEGEAPPEPNYWMHQLDGEAGADQMYCLNPAEFLRQVGRVLQRTSQ